MKILHTIEGMGAKFGGIATCTNDLLNALQGKGHTVELLTPALRNHEDRMLGENTDWLQTFPNDGRGPINYSKNAIKNLRKSEADLFHVNGMWQHICHATAKEARRKCKPYVITPHGMLYPETLKINYWKKWPILQLWFNSDIKLASAFHATCETEMKYLRELGYNGPIAIIGNPIRVDDVINDIYNRRINEPEEVVPVIKNESKIGFLGRLHPRKHIERIIQGLALSKYRNEIRLVIMGSGETGYERSLKEEATKYGLNGQIDFAGFVNGEEKFRRLVELSALFVPSDMENFGMIVPEALLVGTPVMASLGTPWKDLNEYNCGWWRDNSPESIASVIDEVASKTPEELLSMGSRGHDLVLQKYQASKVADQMLQLYSWLLGNADKPDFVYDS